jgi:hypothetical protein
LTNVYTVGPQGEQLEEVDGNFNVLHFNVFWEGKLLGTLTRMGMSSCVVIRLVQPMKMGIPSSMQTA